jgi:hypothetical protein
MKKLLIGLIIAVFLVASVGIVMAKPRGYNWKALVFVGTGMQYCQQRYNNMEITKDACEAAIGEDADDHLVMKWSQAWQDSVFGPDGQRGTNDELPWTTDAWVMNQWNGMVPGGSGGSYHSRIVWVGTPCDDTNPNWRDGGHCIWGQMEVIHKQGKGSAGHYWGAHGIPSGYGQ